MVAANQKYTTVRGLNDHYLLLEYQVMTRDADQHYKLYNLATGEMTGWPLSSSYTMRGALQLDPDRDRIAFYSSNLDGQQGMGIYDIATGQAQLVLSGVAFPIAFMDGNRIIYQDADSSSIVNLFALELDTGAAKSFYAAKSHNDFPNVRVAGTSGGDVLLCDRDFAGIILVDCAPPDPASNLIATVVPGTKQIALSWTLSPSPDAGNYNIYAGLSGGINYSKSIAQVAHPTNSFTTQALPAGTYCFGVRAQDILGVEEMNTDVRACATIVPDKCLVSAAIKIPYDNKVLGGNHTLVKADIFGNKSDVKQVLFQYAPVGSSEWANIVPSNRNSPNPDLNYPYFVHVDVNSLPGPTCQVRAVATDVNGCIDPNPASIIVTVEKHTHCSHNK